MKCTTLRTKITKIRPNLTHFFATLTKTHGFTKKKKHSFWKNDKNKQKFKRFLTKIPKIRPNLTHFFATLTKTHGFTKKKNIAFGKMTKISRNLRDF